jgi:threonine dehydrogenase-like Zn-dependent dehydrogenase
MRALRSDGARIVLDRAAPEPSAGGSGAWALVRPTRTAISAQDLAILRDPSLHTGTLGRAYVGVVERLIDAGAHAAEAKRWTGKRVVGGAWLACGVCDLCRGGLSNHCRDGRTIGLGGVDGCIAERFAAPTHSLVEAPRSVDDDCAVFTDVLARAIHASQQARVDANAPPTVVGDDALALLVAQAMHPVCPRVRVIGWNERSLALCERWGVKHRPAGEAGLRADQSVVVECSGTAEGLFVGASMARPRGRLVLAAPPLADHRRERTTDALRLVHDRELEVIGSRGGSAAEAVALLERAGVDVVSLISRRTKFAEAPEALRAAAEPGMIRVLLEMQ